MACNVRRSGRGLPMYVVLGRRSGAWASNVLRSGGGGGGGLGGVGFQCT